ncbi:hypothetical protein EV05_1010 [Prochlorococcus sp. MIT 0601]|nr:hypothetical protein EV05_1010 [Prochlorococcus sp. MIT 0601]
MNVSKEDFSMSLNLKKNNIQMKSNCCVDLKRSTNTRVPLSQCGY